ncbi:MAG: sulfatase-like hydrolase/transferase [Eubacteriales bacterium]
MDNSKNDNNPNTDKRPLTARFFFTAPKKPLGLIRPVWLSRTVTALAYIAALFFPALMLLTAEYIHFANKAKFFTFISERAPVVVFDLILLYGIFIAVSLVTKRLWCSMLICGGLCGGFAIAEYLKFLLTGDHFYPWDLVQAGNVGLLTSYVKIGVPVLYILLAVFLVVLAALAFAARADIPLRWYIRLPLAALIIFGMWFTVSTPQKMTDTLNSHSMYLEDMAAQDSNYAANGFIGAFTVNVLASNIEKPEGYSKESVEALLSTYTDIPAADGYEYPDIIVVLSESFWDIRKLSGTTFSQNPLENYDRITRNENCVSGRFFTTGFGGGTVRPDFEVLTGMTTDSLPSGAVPFQYVRADTDSYLRPYLSLGYETVALHPYLSNFYQRKSAYPKLGFEELYFVDELDKITEVDQRWRGRQVSDDSFADYLIYMLEKNDAPTFLYGISMENHQPYDDKFSAEETYVTVENPLLDGATLNLVSNFTQGLADADAALGKLADYIDSAQRPTVLVWFGDHAPTLGASYAAYFQSGTIADNTNITAGERLVTQSTPYLIYSNFAFEQSDMVSDRLNTDVASYNLMNLTASLIGAPRTRYMQLLADYYAVVPNYNIRMRIDVTERMQYFIDAQKTVTYDRLKGGKYSQ